MQYRINFRSLIGIVFFLLGSLYTSSPLLAQGNNSISGFVQDQSRTPIPQATVELNDDLNREIARTTTDGGGRYNFYRLRLGRYSIRVSVLGSNLAEQTIELEIASAARSSTSSETVQQNFILRNKNFDPQAPRQVTSVVFAQEVPAEAKKRYEQGLDDLKANRMDRGISELEAAITLFPKYYLALERLGDEYIAKQKYKEAIGAFLTALEVNPKAVGSHYGLAYGLYQLNAHNEALVEVDKALELNSTSVNALFLRGMVLKQIGRYEDAVKSLIKARSKASSPMPDVAWQLSLIYTNNLKKYAGAADELELFLKAKPDYAEAEKVRDLIKKLRAKTRA